VTGSSSAADAISRGAAARTLSTLAVIELSGLTKPYRGELVAVDGVMLTGPGGTVMGLLSANGAGKTTTIR
jgi:ABC-2 type transport system ATP-binding protein